ncbi:MAG: GNAT family N-acetyltransferase [Candidatus Promineifilaceae bacterium]|jgi:ribosomal protein S18 acetylase RimI-like enzyme
MSDVFIQEMDIEDYDEVRALWELSDGIEVSDIDSSASIGRFLKRNEGLSFVARMDDQLVGAVLCGHDGRRGYIDHLAVHPSKRRQGIGRALVSRCLFHLMRMGIRRWNLFVLEDNQDARSFWTHLGWAEKVELVTMSRQDTGGANG